MFERLILCIGTRKGLFVAESSKSRRKFQLRGPFWPGVGVYSALIDTRGKPRIYASSCNPFFGMKVLLSTDLGKTFKETKSAPAFPKDDGRALANIWSLVPGDGKKELFCGVEPAALFRSSDGGDSWEMVPGISNHEHARKWHPGAGGLCMHTILRDGERCTVRLVMNPDKMVIGEAMCTFTYLNLYGYLTDAVVVNRIFPDDVTDPYFGKWKDIQAEHLATVHESFDPVPILTARLFDREMVGIELLSEMGREITAIPLHPWPFTAFRYCAKESP